MSPSAVGVVGGPSRISFDEFKRLDLRVGRIAVAEALPKSKKLLRLEIETGSGVRQIVSGIAKAYSPEELVGQIVIIVANLQPVTLMGVESNGMLLAATTPDGQPVLLVPDNPGVVPPGSKVS